MAPSLQKVLLEAQSFCSLSSPLWGMESPFFSVTPRTFVSGSVSNSGGNGSLMEEPSGLWQNGVDGERQREPEAREPDAVDSASTAAEINRPRRGSEDRYKSSTHGYQVRGRGH